MISFEALSSDDLETLMQDLLQRELNVKLESFTKGRDGGIDLRFLGNSATAPALVVQCKHYEKSGFDKLKNKMVSESVTAKALNASRYILATTVPMTPNRKESLRIATKGLILRDDDIFGKEDIQNLLRKYPEVEKGHFKLWLNSTAVLDRVLNNDVLSRTEGYLEALQAKAKLFVNNSSVEASMELLAKHHVCIISGPPGVGKTTLADILLMRHVANGFQPVIISQDVDEADRLYQKGVAQLFLYDDFLGRTSSLEKLGKNEDGRLLNLMQRVQVSPSKRFILTTREYIFEQARQHYERVDTEEFTASKFLLDMRTYSKNHRARILYNHLYFSGLGEEHLESIVESKKYREIVSNANYNPRVIQTAIDLAIKQSIEPSELPDFLVNAITHPTELWRSVMTQQLSVEQRTILALLAVEDSYCPLTTLESFCFRLSMASEAWQQPLSSIIRGLEGTTVTVTGSGTSTRIHLYNPGVEDAVIHHILTQPPVLRNLILGRPTYKQLLRLWNHANEQSRGKILQFGLRIGDARIAPRRNPEELANSELQRILEFQLSHFIRAILEQGLEPESDTTPYEDVVANVIRMSEYVADGGVEESDYTIIAAALRDRWNRDLGERPATCDLIRLLIDDNSKMPKQLRLELIKSGAEFVFRPGSTTPEDFSAQHALASLWEETPELNNIVSASVMSTEDVREGLQSFIPREVERILGDDKLHQARSTVESWDELLHELGLEDESYLVPLWPEIERAEEDAAEPDYDEDDFRSSREDGHGDVDALFSSLPDR